MPATTKKFLVLFAAPATGPVTASSVNDNGTNRTATGLTGAFNTHTTPALLSAKMPVGSSLKDPANIESVSYALAGSTTGIIAVRTTARAIGDTIAGTLTVGGVVYTANVVPVNAYPDGGLAQDAELAAINNFASALSGAMV